MRLQPVRLAALAAFCCCLFAVDGSSQPLKVAQQLPGSITVRESSSLNLSCGFEPPPDYIIWRFAQADQPLGTLIRCQPSRGTCGSVDEAQTGFVNVSVTAAADGTLTVANLAQGHSGRYQCEGLLMLQSARTETFVSVLVAPTLPSVTANSSQPVAGSTLRLVCSTSGGNPPPSLAWQIRTGGAGFEPATADSVEGVATAAPLTPFGTVTSQLTLAGLRSQLNRAVVRCLATHPVVNLTSPDYVLDVRYNPVVTEMASLTVELGSEAAIECRAAGNPDPVVRLENSAGEILSAVSPLSVSYRLTAHRPTQTGVYRCVGENSLGTSSAPFSIDVQYGPKVSGPGSVTARAGDRLSIECSADANPPPDTAGAVLWTHVPSGRTISGAGSNFAIERVERSDAGVWRCRYRNTLTPNGGPPVQREGAANTTVIVEYAPGLPVTSVTKRQLVRGESLTVACSANAESPGVPSPSFRWTKSGSLFESLGPSLALTNVSLSSSGAYFCTPINAAGQGHSTSISVDVEQPPEWLETQPREQVKASVSTSKDYRLVCTARAKPEASFAWYKDGRLIPAELFSVETKTVDKDAGLRGFRTTSYLNFRGAQRANGELRPQDNGQYQCEASNRRGKISAEIPLMVEFQPQIAPVETKIAKPDGVSVDFSCPLLAQPRPTITWQLSLPSGRSVSVDTSARFQSDPTVPYRYISHLERVSNLGTYTCLATNSLGSAQLSFRVLAPTVPDAPTGLRVISSGWDFVALSWSTAFSGGSPVHYWSRVLSRDSASGQVATDTRRCDTSTRTNITGLMPGTNYTVQIYGLNELGSSNYSAPISQVTSSLSLPKPSSVQMTEDSTKLSVTLTETANYCLRIEASEDSGGSWSLYQYCLTVDSSPAIIAGINANLMYRVSVCLSAREEVCGLTTLSTGSMPLPQVKTSTIIIVGASCSVVIIVLISVLTYFCCKRPKAYKEMDPLNAANNARQPSPPSSQCQYGQVSDGKPYVLVPPHQSFSADDIASVAAAAAAANSVSGNSGSSSGGVSKPLLIAQPSRNLDSTSSRRSSTFLHSKPMEAAVPSSLSCGAQDFQQHQQQQQQQQQQQPTSFGFGERRRSGGPAVFATLGSGHNPLDSSASNPALFCYPSMQQPQQQQLDFTDDNRNTDPYSFDGSYSTRQKKIVYEVVV